MSSRKTNGFTNGSTFHLLASDLIDFCVCSKLAQFFPGLNVALSIEGRMEPFVDLTTFALFSFFRRRQKRNDIED